MEQNAELNTRRRSYAFLRNKLGMKFKIFDGKVYFVDLDAAEMILHNQQHNRPSHIPIDVKELMHPARKRAKSLEISAKLEDFLQQRDSLTLVGAVNQSELFDDNESEVSSRGEVIIIEERLVTEEGDTLVEEKGEESPQISNMENEATTQESTPPVAPAILTEDTIDTEVEADVTDVPEVKGEVETTEADDDNIPAPGLPPPIPPPVPKFVEPLFLDIMVQSDVYFGAGNSQTFAYNFADEYSSSAMDKIFDIKYRLCDMYNLSTHHGEVLLSFWNEDQQSWTDLSEDSWALFAAASHKVINVDCMSTRQHEVQHEDMTQHIDDMPDLPPPPPPPVPSALSAEAPARRRSSTSQHAFAVMHDLHRYHNEFWTLQDHLQRLTGIDGEDQVASSTRLIDMASSADSSAHNAWQLLPYYPPLYCTVRSVNGVSLQALDKDHQMALVKQRHRPILIELDLPEDDGNTPPAFLQPSSNNQPHTPSSSSGKRAIASEPSSPTPPTSPTSADIGISQSFFMTKYTHSVMSKLRKQIDKLIQDFVQCDWRTAQKQNTGSPQMTMISLYKYIEAEMIKLDLFNAKNKNRGAGAPLEMTEKHWDMLRDHIECFMYARVSDYSKTLLYPIYRKEWMPCTELDDIFNDAESDEDDEEQDAKLPRKQRVDYVLMIHPNLSVTTHYHPKNSSMQRIHRRVILSPDHSLQERMSYYRFVLLAQLGAKSPEDSHPSNVGDGEAVSLPLPGLLEEVRRIDAAHFALLQKEEWYLAMKALQATTQESLPSRILQRLKAVFQLLSAALMSYLQGGISAGIRSTWLCGQCNKCHLSKMASDTASMEDSVQDAICLQQVCSQCGAADSATAMMISADDLLPAIIWTLLQSSPALLEQAVWICAEFRHPSLLRGEEGYCLAQLSSAIEFCQYVTASQLDMSTAVHDFSLLRYMRSRRLLLACENGDLSAVQQCLAEEETASTSEEDDKDVARTAADVNAYDMHYQHSALSKAILHHHFPIVCFLLQQSHVRVNQPLFLFNGGQQERSTALILAVQQRQIKTVVALLHAGANRYQVDEHGRSPLAHAKQLLAQPTQPSSHTSTHVAVKKEEVRLLELVLYADFMKFDLAQVLLTAHFTLQHHTLSEFVQPKLAYFCQPSPHVPQIKGKGQYRSLEAESILVGLLLQGTDVNQGPVFTPLIAAVMSGNMSMLRLVLLAAYIGVSPELDLDARNAYGETALLVAVKCCLLTKRWTHFQMVAMLLRYGAHRQLRYRLDGKEQTVQELVSHVSTNPFAGEDDNNALLLSGAIKDYFQQHPIHARNNLYLQPESGLDLEELLMSRIMHEEDVLTQLGLLLRLNPFLEDSSETRVYESSKARNLSNVRNLLFQGVDVNTVCVRKGYHALIAAVFNEDLHMLRLLLDSADFINALTCCIHREEVFGTAEVVRWYDVCLDFYNASPSMVVLQLPLHRDTTASAGRVRFSSHPYTAYSSLDLNLKGRGGMTALHYAAQLGNFTILTTLIKRGADRYVLNDKQHRALDIVLLNHTLKELANVLRYDPMKVSICLAAKHGDLVVLTALLQQGVSINYVDPLCLDPKLSITLTPTLIREQVKMKNGLGIRYDLFCPLICMAAAGQYEAMRTVFSEEFTETLLVEEDIDVNMVTPVLQTALMYAAALGHENMVVLLLKHGADRYVRDIADMSALDWAASQEHFGVARILQHDPDRVYIHDLIREGDLDGVVAMLKQGVDVNTPRDALDPFSAHSSSSSRRPTTDATSSSTANTASTGNATKRNSSLMSWIRNAPNTSNERTFIPGERPLIVAARFNRPDILKLLLKAPDIRIDDVDANGWTALFHAGFVGNESIVLALLRAGASREVLDNQGFSAVNVALQHHIVFGGSNAANPVASLTYSPSVPQQDIAALIEADPHRMLIHDVCEQGRIHHVKAIFKQGCPVNFRDERAGKLQQSPLMAASSGGKADVVKLLLRNEEVVQEINERDTEGRTALMRAASVVAFDVTALLLNAGCDRSLKDHKGLTAVDHAAAHGFSTKMQFISQTMIR